MPPPGASRHERIVAVHLLDICVMLSLSHQFLRGVQLVWIYYTAKLYLFAKETPPQTYPVVGTTREPTSQTASTPIGTNRTIEEIERFLRGDRGLASEERKKTSEV